MVEEKKACFLQKMALPVQYVSDAVVVVAALLSLVFEAVALAAPVFAVVAVQVLERYRRHVKDGPVAEADCCHPAGYCHGFRD